MYSKLRTKAWRENNKEFVAARSKRRRELFPEKINAWMKAWRERNAEHIKEYSKQYYRDNVEQVLPKRRKWHRDNNERSRQNNKNWKSANPDKVKMYDHLKRARKNGAPGFCNPEQWEARFNYHGRKCRYCCCKLDDSTVQVEHMIPLRHGGTNWPSNLVPSCRFCNTSKKDKTYKQFIRYIKENPDLFGQG